MAVRPASHLAGLDFLSQIGRPGWRLSPGIRCDPSLLMEDLILLSACGRARHTRGMKPFEDRVDAGRQLAQRLDFLRGQDVVVLGLPRGGVPVAFEVAEALGVPLDVLVVRKLGVPFQPELAFGAIGEGGVRVINDSVVRATNLSSDDMDAVEGEQRVELQRRSERFRRGHGMAARRIRW